MSKKLQSVDDNWIIKNVQQVLCDCTSAVGRLHISCCAAEEGYISSTTYVSSSTDFLYLFQRLDLYALKV